MRHKPNEKVLLGTCGAVGVVSVAIAAVSLTPFGAFTFLLLFVVNWMFYFLAKKRERRKLTSMHLLAHGASDLEAAPAFDRSLRLVSERVRSVEPSGVVLGEPPNH